MKRAVGWIFTLAALAFVVFNPALCVGAEAKLQTLVLDRFTGITPWHVTSLTGQTGRSAFQTTPSGGNLKCDFSKSPGYVGIGTPGLSIPGSPTHFEIQVLGDLDTHTLVLRLFDSNEEAFQSVCKKNEQALENGAYNYTADWTDGNGWAHFGGDNDGHPIPPMRVGEIIVDKNEGKAKFQATFLQLAAISLASSEECLRVTFPPMTNNGLFLTDTPSSLMKIQIPVTLDNLLGYPQTIKAHFNITNAENVQLGEGSWEFTVPAFSRQQQPITVEPNRHGWFRFSLTGMNSEKQETMFVLSSKREKTPPEPDSPFGMGIYFGNRYSPEDRRKAGFLASQAGIRWSREEFSWGNIEPKQGRFNWKEYDDALRAARDSNVLLFGLLDYTSPWASTAPADAERRGCWLPNLDAWRNYVTHVVKRYGSQIKYWEVWNEPNGFWAPKANPAEYFEILKVAFEAIKTLDPSAKVIGLSTAGTDLKFIEPVLAAGGINYFDILSVHPYRYPNSPEASNFLGELEGAHQLLKKYGMDKPVWITEIGWPAHQGEASVSPETQAQMLARTYLLACASKLVDKVFWYDFRDDGDDPNEREHRFGILQTDLTPKPAYLAYKTMTEQIANKIYDGTVDLGLGTEIHALSFKRDGQRTLAIWSEKSMRNALLRVGDAPVVLCNLWGEQLNLQPQQGRVVISLSQSPVFLTGCSEIPVALPFDLTWTGEPEILLPEGGATIIEAKMTNPFSQPFSGEAFFELTDGVIPEIMELPVHLPDATSALLLSTAVQTRPDLDAKTEQHIRIDLGREGEYFGYIENSIRIVPPIEAWVSSELGGERGAYVFVRNRSNAPMTVSIDFKGFPTERPMPVETTIGACSEQKEFFPVSSELLETESYQSTAIVSWATGRSVTSTANLSFLSAPRFRSPPRIDGNLREWTKVSPIKLDQKDNVHTLIGEWGGPEDISARVSVAWDFKFFYLTARIKDATFAHPYQGGEGWKNDGLQFAIRCPAKDSKAVEYTEIGLTITDDGPEVCRLKAVGERETGILMEALVGYRQQQDETCYEAAIPWSELGVTPSMGAVLGFNVLVNDNDDQERKTFIEWAGGTGFRKDPGLFANLILR